jgi:hypothetical protein
MENRIVCREANSMGSVDLGEPATDHVFLRCGAGIETGGARKPLMIVSVFNQKAGEKALSRGQRCVHNIISESRQTACGRGMCGALSRRDAR